MVRNVMVVEDDVDIRESLIDTLEDDGIVAIAASNGREALEKLRQLVVRPCLILLDLMMPVMDGHAFREAQLTIPELEKIPVVVISAYRDVEEQARALNADGFMRKPLRVDEIRRVTEQFCGEATA